MFVTAAINSAPAFKQLAEYVEAEKTPKNTYQFLYKAMELSKLKRGGGKINQGMLEFLTPLVIANVLHDPSFEKGPDFILEKASEVLKRTTREDVKNLIEMKKLGNIYSGVEKKYPVREHDVDNVFDYYQAEYEKELSIRQNKDNLLQKAYDFLKHPLKNTLSNTFRNTLKNIKRKDNITSVVHNAQFVKAFPDIKLAYNALTSHNGKKFEERVEKAYSVLFQQPGKEKMGPGLAADFIAAALYLAFSYSKEKEIVN
jgi:triphosphoribosyl-dephospho-CoA synthetase